MSIEAIPPQPNIVETKKIINDIGMIGDMYISTQHIEARVEFNNLITQLYQRLMVLEGVFTDGRQQGYIEGLKHANTTQPV